MAETHVKFRHKVYFTVLRPVGRLLALLYHFHTKPKRMAKGEQYLILSNHQGALDPALLALSFRAPIYFVATDTIFSTKWYSRLMVHCFAPIKKRKAAVDLSCVKSMMRVAKEGGSIALFPDGNRVWCDFQFPIQNGVCKLARILRLPILLYNFEGGYGVDPRWGKGLRSGKHVGRIACILTTAEIAAMTDEQLHEAIMTGLRVFDADSGERYRSRKRAENLEHMLFVCPRCRSMSTIRTKGARIFCTACDMQAEYTEQLRLSAADARFPFERLAEWYRFQQQFVRDYRVTAGETLFSDAPVRLLDKTTEQQPLLAQGTLTMTDQALKIGDFTLPLAEITGASPVGSRRLTVNTADKSYVFIGDEHFNPIKYLLFFNVLCAQIKSKGGDPLYGLSTGDHENGQLR